MAANGFSHPALPFCAKFSCPTIPTEKDWEAFRGLITQLYLDRDYTLEDVVRFMLREYNFRAT